MTDLIDRLRKASSRPAFWHGFEDGILLCLFALALLIALISALEQKP